LLFLNPSDTNTFQSTDNVWFRSLTIPRRFKISSIPEGRLGGRVGSSSVVDPKLFFSDPYPDPTFHEISDPAPDPTQLLSKEAEDKF